MSKEIKRANHYIPKTYLEKFQNNQGVLYVYKKGEKFFKKGITKEKRILTVFGKGGLDKIAVKKDLYIPTGEFIKDRNILEDLFCDEFETKYNAFIGDLQNENISFGRIIEKHQEYIINLIASVFSRTLHSKKELEEMYKANIQTYHKIRSMNQKWNRERIKSLKDNLRKKKPELSEQKINESTQDYFKMIEEGKFEVNFPRNRFIKEMIMRMQMFTQIISDMTIQVLKNKTSFPFITSDAPVVYFVPKVKVNFYFGPKSLGGPYTELYFPLTKNLCLLLTRRKTRILDYVYITQGNLARLVNYNIAHNSRDFIFSPEKNTFLDEFIEKYIPYPFKIKIS